MDEELREILSIAIFNILKRNDTKAYHRYIRIIRSKLPLKSLKKRIREEFIDPKCYNEPQIIRGEHEKIDTNGSSNELQRTTTNRKKI